MKTILLLYILLLSGVLESQQDTLNSVDSNGKKMGWWLVYLGAVGEKMDDSTKAVYKRFTYFDNGTNIYPMGDLTYRGGKLTSSSGTATLHSKIRMLDGEYVGTDKKGVKRFVHVFKNGRYVSYTEFYESGERKTFFDYTKHFPGQPLSWYSVGYKKKRRN